MNIRPRQTNESFVRWQGRYIEQRQTASSVMLGLSGGSLAYVTSLLSGVNAFIGFWPSIAFHLTVACHAFSVGAAVLYSLNRVRDFAVTAKIARDRAHPKRKDNVPELRKQQRTLGQLTRRLYFWQSILFLAGALFFLVFCSYHLSPALYAAA